MSVCALACVSARDNYSAAGWVFMIYILRGFRKYVYKIQQLLKFEKMACAFH